MRDRKDIAKDFQICKFSNECYGCSYYDGNDCIDSINGLDNEIIEILANEKDYEDGLKDAWGIARTVANMDVKEFNECFGTDIGLEDVINLYKPEEIKKKIEEYENEFHVGDVVRSGRWIGVVTRIISKRAKSVYILFNDGSCGTHSVEGFEKTGEKIDLDSLFTKIVSNN